MNRNLTLALDAGWSQSDRGAHWLAGAGLRTGFGGVATKLDFGLESGGGKAAELALAGTIKGATYRLTHAEYSGGFTDEVRGFTNEALQRASEFTLNGSLKLGGAKALPLSAQFRRIEQVSGLVATSASLRTRSESLPSGSPMISFLPNPWRTKPGSFNEKLP